MKSSTLTVVAQAKAKPGQEGELRRDLLIWVAPSRKDAGCINYDMHESADEPGKFFFHENWSSKELWDAHMRKPDLQATLSRLAQLVAEPPQITLGTKWT